MVFEKSNKVYAYVTKQLMSVKYFKVACPCTPVRQIELNFVNIQGLLVFSPCTNMLTYHYSTARKAKHMPMK